MNVERVTEGATTIERNSLEYETSVLVEWRQFDSGRPKKSATRHEMNKGSFMQVSSSLENKIRIVIVLWRSSRSEHNKIVIQVERTTEGTNTVEGNSLEYET